MRPVAVFLPLSPPLFNESHEGLFLVGSQQLLDPLFRLREDQTNLGVELTSYLPHLPVGFLDDLANSLPLSTVQVEFPVHPSEYHLGHRAWTTPDHPFNPLLVDEMRRQSASYRTE